MKFKDKQKYYQLMLEQNVALSDVLETWSKVQQLKKKQRLASRKYRQKKENKNVRKKSTT